MRESAPWAEFKVSTLWTLASNLKERDNAGLISPSCTANRTLTHTLNKRMVLNFILCRKWSQQWILHKEMKFVCILKYLHRSCGCNCRRPSSQSGLNIWGTLSVQNRPPEDQSLVRRRQSWPAMAGAELVLGHRSGWDATLPCSDSRSSPGIPPFRSWSWGRRRILQRQQRRCSWEQGTIWCLGPVQALASS